MPWGWISVSCANRWRSHTARKPLCTCGTAGNEPPYFSPRRAVLGPHRSAEHTHRIQRPMLCGPARRVSYRGPPSSDTCRNNRARVLQLLASDFNRPAGPVCRPQRACYSPTTACRPRRGGGLAVLPQPSVKPGPEQVTDRDTRDRGPRGDGWVAPLWWTDGVGQADPSHLRLRRT
jgi:hypothetical protein